MKHSDLLTRVKAIEKRHEQEDCFHDFSLVSMSLELRIFFGMVLIVSSTCSKCKKNVNRITYNEPLMDMYRTLTKFAKDGIEPEKKDTKIKKKTK